MVEMRASESLINPLTGIIPAMRRWELFLQDQGRSPHTIKAFLGDIALLAAFLPTDKTIGQVTTDDLNRFLAWLQNGRNTPCSPKSLSRRVTSLKAFFRWLASAGRIPSNPAEKVLQQSVISPLPEVLTPDETVRVLEAADLLRTAGRADSRPYALLSLLLETGIKKGECLNLSINHIDLGAPRSGAVYPVCQPIQPLQRTQVGIVRRLDHRISGVSCAIHPHRRYVPLVSPPSGIYS